MEELMDKLRDKKKPAVFKPVKLYFNETQEDNTAENVLQQQQQQQQQMDENGNVVIETTTRNTPPTKQPAFLILDSRDKYNFNRDEIVQKITKQLNAPTARPTNNERIRIKNRFVLGKRKNDDSDDEDADEDADNEKQQNPTTNPKQPNVFNENLSHKTTRGFKDAVLLKKKVGTVVEKVPAVGVNKNISQIDIAETAQINNQNLLERLPPRQKIVLRSKNYFLNNRQITTEHLSQLFAPYEREMKDLEKNNDTCEKQQSNQKFELLAHQKIVREYLNVYTPYRGLLLYHGLGSGKTCSSIAIAEGMKHNKEILLLTPASLRSNFFAELKKCGDLMYQVEQHWDFISIDTEIMDDTDDADTDTNANDAAAMDDVVEKVAANRVKKTAGDLLRGGGSPPTTTETLSALLSLNQKWIEKNKGAWLMDRTKKTANFSELSFQQQEQIQEQLDEMIRSKYIDINYNANNFGKKINNLSVGGTRNPFDDRVVIIDEAHNFISRIVNKLKYNKKSKVWLKNTQDALYYKTYEMLMSAVNVKIVMLTGTPIINYPYEIAILFNILRGYIQSWEFSFTASKQTIDREQIISALQQDNNKIFDYVDIVNSNTAVITRNPVGFVNTAKKATAAAAAKPNAKPNTTKNNPAVKKGGTAKFTTKPSKNKTRKIIREEYPEELPEELKDEAVVVNDYYYQDPYDRNVDGGGSGGDGNYLTTNTTLNTLNNTAGMFLGGGEVVVGGGKTDYMGVSYDETANIADSEFVSQVLQTFKKKQWMAETVSVRNVKTTLNKALPDIAEDFIKNFVDMDNLDIQNRAVFQKRIMGLTSYFRIEQESLLPRFVLTAKKETFFVEQVYMSDYQLSVYIPIRDAEAKADSNKKKKKAMAKEGAVDLTSSTYRIFSRMACNFAFPEEVVRPKPPKKEMDKMIIGGGENADSDDEDDAEDEDEDDADDEEPEAEGTAGIVLKMKDVLQRTKPPTTNPNNPAVKVKNVFRNKKNIVEDKVIPEEVDVDENPAVKKVNETEADVEAAAEAKEEDDEADEDEEEDSELSMVDDVDADVILDDDAVVEENYDEITDKTYKQEIQATIAALREGSRKWLTPKGLEIYSPKFRKILQNVLNKDNRGKHLIYSQFRQLEGIEILKLVLETNGMMEFTVFKNNNEWDVAPEILANPKPKFMLYTGTESREEKEVLLNIYNGKWGLLSKTLADKLLNVRDNQTNNMGDIIKVMMITQSGTEGINLKNTRFVHIVEPFWNWVRIEQVIGRARRICSHQDLPEELRTVQVFIYTSCYNPTQMQNKQDFLQIMLRDVSKRLKITAKGGTFGDPIPFTSDQTLLENSQMKDELNQKILSAVKETAMDCSVYKDLGNGKGKQQGVCVSNKGVKDTDQFISYPTLERDMQEISEVITKKKKIFKLKVGAANYVVDDENYKEADETDLYDYAVYAADKRLRKVGVYRRGEDGKLKVELV